MKIIKHANLPKPNITAQEREALADLASDRSITILPADKGRAVVVMNLEDYKKKAQTLLNDKKTYRILDKDPTAKYTANLIKQLQEIKRDGGLTEPQYKRLYPTGWHDMWWTYWPH